LLHGRRVGGVRYRLVAIHLRRVVVDDRLVRLRFFRPLPGRDVGADARSTLAAARRRQVEAVAEKLSADDILAISANVASREP
jgi:hypothetical protein